MNVSGKKFKGMIYVEGSSPFPDILTIMPEFGPGIPWPNVVDIRRPTPNVWIAFEGQFPTSYFMAPETFITVTAFFTSQFAWTGTIRYDELRIE